MLLLPVFHPMPYPMCEARRTPLIRSAINPTMRRRLRVAKPRSKAAGAWLVLPPCSASRSTGSGSLGSPSPFSSARRENLRREDNGAVRVPGDLSGFCIFTIEGWRSPSARINRVRPRRARTPRAPAKFWPRRCRPFRKLSAGLKFGCLFRVVLATTHAGISSSQFIRARADAIAPTK